VKFAEFLLGLGLGLGLLFWQRSRYEERLRRLLKRADIEFLENSPFSLSSQLAMAIAHQKDDSEATKQQLEVYRKMLHHAPFGFLQVDEENCLIWSNPQARAILGIPVSDAERPRLLLELVRSFELDELIEQTRQSEKPCQKDWIFYPASDDHTIVARQQPRALRGYGYPLLNRAVGIYLESRQEAMMLKQQRDRWISDVAHELKTPLTSIRLVAETLHGRLSPPMQGWVERLIREATRLSILVQDLLDLSHLERESSRCLALKTVNLKDLIQSAWLNLEPLASKKHLRLEFEGDAAIPVQVDESRMYRAFLNILDNSIKYSPPRQCILVQATLQPSDTEVDPAAPPSEKSASPPWVWIDIVDSGPGFTNDTLSHVFDRFFREDPSRARYSTSTDLADSSPTQASTQSPGSTGYQSGSGLGLSIVQQIIEAHSGKIMADNHPETHGAWIQIQLPQYPPSLPSLEG
jgi:two-component system phosphate regulon sensor histidine kinase PhoR